MQNKKTNFTLLLITGLLIATAATAIGFYASRPQSVALAGNGVVQQSAPNQDKPVSAPTPQAAGEKVLSKTVNEVTIEITSAKVIETGVEIGICYTTLDGGDWYPTPGYLFYSTYEIYPDEFEFTTETKADGKNPGKRCALVRYKINELDSIATPIQFSVLDIYAVPREMYSACQNFQQRLDTNPKAKAYGLKAKCVENSDGNISVTLADRDKSVPKDNASTVLDEIAKGVVNGPWEFTIAQIEK